MRVVEHRAGEGGISVEECGRRHRTRSGDRHADRFRQGSSGISKNRREFAELKGDDRTLLERHEVSRAVDRSSERQDVLNHVQCDDAPPPESTVTGVEVPLAQDGERFSDRRCSSRLSTRRIGDSRQYEDPCRSTEHHQRSDEGRPVTQNACADNRAE